MRWRRRVAGAIAILSVCAVAACGSSGASHSQTNSTPSTGSASSSQTTTAAPNAATSSACKSLTADVGNLSSPDGLKNYGEDLLKLSSADPNDSSTAIQGVGAAAKVLKDIAYGSSSPTSQSDLSALEANVTQVQQICGGK